MENDLIKIACEERYKLYDVALEINQEKWDKSGIVEIYPNLNNYRIIIEIKVPNIKYSIIEDTIYFNGRPININDRNATWCGLTKFFGKNGSKVKSQEVNAAIDLIAHQNKFDGLVDYFINLPLPTTKYIDNWLHMITGCEDTPLTRSIGRKWLISGVARAMEPGCYVEGALIFKGDQAAGKSVFFKTICPEEKYFSATPINLADTRTAVLQLKGIFLVEFAELTSVSKQDREIVKQFLTAQNDKINPKYSNDKIDLPRRVIFGGSTNNFDFLSDPTGNRRFWVIEAPGKIDLIKVKEIKDDLWSEAYNAYKNGESWTLSETELIELNNYLGAYMEDDPLASFLQQELNEEPFLEQNEILSHEINALAKRYDNRVHFKKVSSVMIKLGWERGQKTSGQFKGQVSYKRK